MFDGDILATIIMAMFALASICALFLAVSVMVLRWRAISKIKKLHYIAIVVCCVGAVNFICGIGIVEIGTMGGRAMTGKIEQGQSYLGNFGEYTPVSSSTFLICKYYEISVYLIIILSLVGALVSYSLQEEPKETLSPKVIKAIREEERIKKH